MNRINGLILTTVLALALCSIAASFFTASLAQPGQQDPSSSRKPACGCFICGDLAREASRKGIILPFNFVEFEDKKDCAGILSEDACPAELAQIPKEKREGFCQKIKAGLDFTSFKDSCPVLAAACEPEDKTPPEEKKPDEKNPKCENYSGEITCDCNADGQDETTKAFESCGLPSNWPRQFKSRCEDWVQTDGGYGYGTDIAIQHQAQDYLASLRCSALKCHREYKACEQEAQEEYEKCIYSGVRRVRVSCLRQQNAANNKCVQSRDNCMKQIRRFGPGTGPRPQPLPTQTPPA